jgi:hypothetical protein
VRRVRYPLFFPRRCVLPWAQAARRLLCRSQGKRRRQALCRRVDMRPTGNWASDNTVFTLPCRSCGTAISAPSLRLPLCRHAMFPLAFRRRVRRLTSGTFLRFPGHLCGDMQLAVTAHAHRVGIPTPEHLVHETVIVALIIARVDAFKPVPVLGKDLFEDAPGWRSCCNHQAASLRSVGLWVIVLFYHIPPTTSTPSSAFPRARSPTLLPLAPRGRQGYPQMEIPILLSLSRLNHRLPGREAHPEVVQGTTDFHHEITDPLLLQADAVFDDATALDTTVDMLDPQPTLVQRLVRHVLLQRELSPRGFLVGMRIST